MLAEKKNVRGMFARIAPFYDALNHILSFSIDRLWRKRTVRRILEAVETPRCVLDVCAGTGDLTLLFSERLRDSGALVVGLDFTHPMLEIARRKTARKKYKTQPIWLEGDALCLPFADSMFDVSTMAFGLRNLTDPQTGLREMARVTHPGGVVAVLEFHLPRHGVLRWGYYFYLHGILPVLGNVVSGSKAYRYLSRSIAEFASPEGVSEWMREAGLREVQRENIFGRAVVLHWGRVL
ncbi:TPA: bifunctional demethylmenaquinone methyltransferase/2-methoxy-6-polyprenyl-1,4-benzoquinol methylase UbiE [Candidatus Sumerlaeota bacterium]|jgi:demethylmenaquinone methyltransferase / 2-methoxy-6-polyprenyl-1,4-benzoquinol methylase|nr:bifunctional demethylmenaquinone methyltransferase/2-methoxy-6-polyprenyl-1,4-benzoquinol methylase UbiE [Candidatus Sumerlaeota bacterium]